jgi:hypothetical protein
VLREGAVIPPQADGELVPIQVGFLLLLAISSAHSTHIGFRYRPLPLVTHRILIEAVLIREQPFLICYNLEASKLATQLQEQALGLQRPYLTGRTSTSTARATTRRRYVPVFTS